MRHLRFVLVLALAALVAACGEDDSIETGSGSEGATGTGGTGGSSDHARVDLSTPENAVREFCAAAADRDTERMALTIAEGAGEGALRRILLGQLRPGEEDDLPDLALREMHGTRMGRDGNDAVVSVTFESGRDEQIHVVRTPAGWKIDDF
jgi:hypothetical protein